MSHAFSSYYDDYYGSTYGQHANSNRDGAGSESRQPLGLPVFGSLLVSQMVTLFSTSVFCIYLDNKLQHKLLKHSDLHAANT
jgi:hypothetical protein